MLIRVILLLALAAIGYFVFVRRQRLPVHVVLIFALLAMAGTFVLVPDITNKIANALGVGRGADLVNYVVQVSLFFIVIHYYTKFVDLEMKLTTVVRELAILRAQVGAVPPPRAAEPEHTARGDGQSSLDAAAR